MIFCDASVICQSFVYCNYNGLLCYTQFTTHKLLTLCILQSLQVQLSYSQCSEAPVKMNVGRAVTINGKVYYGGGACGDNDDEYCVHCYDPPQDVWSTLPRLPVRYFGLGEVKGELVVVAGMDFSLSVSNVVHVFNKGRNWKRTISSMPIARSWPAVFSLRTHLVVAVGWSLEATLIMLRSTTSEPPSGARQTDYRMLVMTKEGLSTTTQCT